MTGNRVFRQQGLDQTGGQKAEDHIGCGIGQDMPGFRDKLREKISHLNSHSSFDFSRELTRPNSNFTATSSKGVPCMKRSKISMGLES